MLWSCSAGDWTVRSMFFQKDKTLRYIPPSAVGFLLQVSEHVNNSFWKESNTKYQMLYKLSHCKLNSVVGICVNMSQVILERCDLFFIFSKCIPFQIKHLFSQLACGPFKGLVPWALNLFLWDKGSRGLDCRKGYGRSGKKKTFWK